MKIKNFTLMIPVALFVAAGRYANVNPFIIKVQIKQNLKYSNYAIK